MVYAIEYVKDGRLVTKVIGGVNDISLNKARKRAAALLSENQITARPARSQITADTKREIESRSPKDRTRSRQSKAVALPTPPVKVPVKLVTFDELKEIYSIPYTRRHIDRLEATGNCPKRVPIGERRVGWLASEIEAHIEQRIATRSMGFGTLGSGRKLGRPT